MQTIRIRVLVDRSGSMGSWKKPVVGGLNAYVTTVKEDRAGRDAELMMATFDSMGFDLVRKGVARDIKLLDESEFVPRALTPLYDATGSTLTDDVDEDPKIKNVAVLLTDGMENASKTYTTATIRALIEKRQSQGWIIIYLGANVDAWQQAEAIGIPKERAMNVHMRGTNAQPKPGIWGKLRGGTSNPVAMALVAAAGLGLAYALLKPGDAAASTLGFTEVDRNAAMGVDGTTKTWQDAVKEDIDGFNEPYDSIFDLPSDLQQDIAELPPNFDPAQGSIGEDGEQTGGLTYDDEIRSADDVDVMTGKADAEPDIPDRSDSGASRYDKSDNDDPPAAPPSRDYSDATPSSDRGSSTFGGFFGGGGGSTKSDDGGSGYGGGASDGGGDGGGGGGGGGD